VPPSGKQRQILGLGRLGAIVAAAAHEHPRPDNAGDHGMLCLIGGGAVQDAVTDVTAGLIEGHHDGTVTPGADIQRLANPINFHYFIISFHY
jgi:hypothetical protein